MVANRVGSVGGAGRGAGAGTPGGRDTLWDTVRGVFTPIRQRFVKNKIWILYYWKNSNKTLSNILQYSNQ